MLFGFASCAFQTSPIPPPPRRELEVVRAEAGAKPLDAKREPLTICRLRDPVSVQDQPVSSRESDLQHRARAGEILEQSDGQVFRLDLHQGHCQVENRMAGIVKLSGRWQSSSMKTTAVSYHGYRFPPEIISHAVWVYYRFCLSFRDTEDLLADRGITVSHETIRTWCRTFGLAYARTLRQRRGRMGDTWFLDELFVNIQGQRQYLWRAVDEDGDVIDILVQSRRDRRAAARFFRKY